jgi:DNA-binding NarL/FixJ family response regulator
VSAGRVARVLIADPDESTRTGVRLALASEGFEVCAEADSAESAVAHARSERPDICLLDADLPGGGISAVEEIVQKLPGIVVVMLSGSVDEERLFAAVHAGAKGYLLKDMDPARLPSAVRGALEGEAALPRWLMGRVLDALRARDRGPHAVQLSRLGVELTTREREVLDLLDRGLQTSEIGEQLSISTVTVRRHVSEILRKLGAPDRQAALRILRAAGG